MYIHTHTCMYIYTHIYVHTHTYDVIFAFPFIVYYCCRKERSINFVRQPHSYFRFSKHELKTCYSFQTFFEQKTLTLNHEMGLGWGGVGLVGLCWVGLCWFVLCCVGLGCVGLGCVGLGWVVLVWVGLHWVGLVVLGWVVLCWVGLGWSGVEWYLCCRLKPATQIPLQPNHTETPTHIEPRTIRPLW